MTYKVKLVYHHKNTQKTIGVKARSQTCNFLFAAHFQTGTADLFNSFLLVMWI